MNTLIETKLKEVKRNQSSGIRVIFEDKVFEHGDVISADPDEKQQYYVMEKSRGVYDISPIKFKNKNAMPSTSDLRVGNTFHLVSRIIGEGVE